MDRQAGEQAGLGDFPPLRIGKCGKEHVNRKFWRVAGRGILLGFSMCLALWRDDG